MKEVDTKNVAEMSADELSKEEQRLRVQMMRTSVEKQLAMQEERARKHRAQQEAIENERQQHEAEQRVCTHRKGGRNSEQFFAGSDSKFSIVKNTYPWGEQGAMCTRCLKEWRKPSEDLKKANSAEYDRLLEEYKWALAAPTDNEPSGNALFVITRNTPAPRKRAPRARKTA